MYIERLRVPHFRSLAFHLLATPGSRPGGRRRLGSMLAVSGVSLSLLACDPTKPTVEGGGDGVDESDVGDEGASAQETWTATAGDGSDADPSSDGSTGDSGGEGGLDPSKLDRSADCIQGADACGYPSPGAKGYGTDLGDRFENFKAKNCDGDAVEFADLFQPDESGQHTTRGVIFTMAAGWCEPCKEETKDLVAHYEEFTGKGVKIVQVLFQQADASPPTTRYCGLWEEEYGTQFPVWIDQTADVYPIWLDDPASSTPITVITDANANIRVKSLGAPPNDLPGEVDDVANDPYGR